MTIWIYISGNLAAESMLMIATHLETRYSSHYELISDGFLPTLSFSQKSKIKVIDPFGDQLQFQKGDFLLLGIMTPGNKERSLLKKAQGYGITSIAFINDICGSPGKLHDECQNLILPDFIFLADMLSYQKFRDANISLDKLLPAGSVYIDSIDYTYADRNNTSRQSIGYFSVPNTDDSVSWNIDIGYSETEIAEDLKEAINKVCGTLTIRKHPKEKGSEKYSYLKQTNISIEEADESVIESFIIKHSFVVSSYSTALVVAHKLGIPAISYQPGVNSPIRAQLYSSLGIPIVRNVHELIEILSKNEIHKSTPNAILFNPGKALDYICNFLINRFKDNEN